MLWSVDRFDIRALYIRVVGKCMEKINFIENIWGTGQMT